MTSPTPHASPYDVIVVGAGHAGIEAALAAARLGAQVLVLTKTIDRTGWLSCNPALGGLGKGHLIKEIDAMGGVMARVLDKSAIQFRRLNASKGPAVRGSRAQADKVEYAKEVRRVLEHAPGVQMKEATVEDLILRETEDGGHEVLGVRSNFGLDFYAKAIILTTGTFLGGLLHYGDLKIKGGRAGEGAAYGLGATLVRLGFQVGRLKTGTVPRLDGRTIDWSRLEIQESDENPRPFSMYGPSEPIKSVPCYITRTNAKTHEIIRNNLDRSPLYSGQITGLGPRYCPSLEDKIVRFADKDSHNIFLEPEGLSTPEIYPNGISTSLPIEVQIELVRSIEGLENAEITRPGYAVEYDFVDPRELHPSLETKKIAHLFFAGQLNGTTGYEEAAAQGLVAGINAVRRYSGEDAFILDRAEAYTGVMIDDLVTRGVKEPYRMFTSRAEYRLHLREDNADERLKPMLRAEGLEALVAPEVWEAFDARMARVEDAVTRLQTHILKPDRETRAQCESLGIQPISQPTSLADLLQRPGLTLRDLIPFAGPWLEALEEEDWQAFEKVEVRLAYAGYLERQERQVQRFKKLEAIHLPSDIDYAIVPGLTTEAVDRLQEAKPHSLGQAARLIGVTPGTISALMVYLKKHSRAAH